MSFLFTNPFDELVEQATSENVPIGTDLTSCYFEIADKIKAKEVQPKTAMNSIKKRLCHKNPNVQILALNLTDICIKNGGQPFLLEIASKEFVDAIAGIIRGTSFQNSELRQKALLYLQNWGISFKSNSSLCYMTSVYESCRQEGVIFPPVDKQTTQSIMIDTKTAPEWSDSEVCTRCRTKFTTFIRKHHCRNCGNTFCNECSSKKSSLPALGIVEEVRVCDGCHIELVASKYEDKKPVSNKAEQVLGNAADEEDEELRLAIAASLESETSSKKKSKKSKKQVSFKDHSDSADQEDEDLKAAIAASLRESSKPSTGVAQEQNDSTVPYPRTFKETETDQVYYPSSTTTPGTGFSSQQVQIPQLKAETTLELFSSREMESVLLFSELVEKTDADVALRGIHTLNYNQLQNTFNQIIHLQQKLYTALNEAEMKRKYYHDLNNRLSDAVRSYEKLLQDRLTFQQGQPSFASSNYYYKPQGYPSSEPGYSDHGFSLPPTPAQPAYGDFYQRRVSELSFHPPQPHPPQPYYNPMPSYPQQQQQQPYYAPPAPSNYQEYPSSHQGQEYSSYGQGQAPSSTNPPPQQQQQQSTNEDAPLIEL